jgi:hypothetical protein
MKVSLNELNHLRNIYREKGARDSKQREIVKATFTEKGLDKVGDGE